ncbi:MAG: hypothetical protein CMJ08_05635 [Pelagibacterales bacterium]|nr:hypothetical protein [Pelagibacterales bacterium]
MVTVGNKSFKLPAINLVVRCNAGKSSEYGTGHLVRSIKIINFLSKKKINKKVKLFLVYYSDNQKIIKNTLKQLKYSSCEIIKLKKLSEEIKLMHRLEPHIVIFDTYNTSKKTIETLKNKNTYIMTLDNKGKGNLLSDVSIFSLIEPKYLGKVSYIGLKYLVLGNHISKKSLFKEKASRVAVSLGGYDKRGLIFKILEILPKISKDPTYMLFTNHNNINRVKKIIKYKHYLDYKIEIYNYPNNYYSLVKLADIGIVSGGLTMFDFLNMGIPSLCLPQYKHQLLNIKNLAKQNIILQGSQDMYISKNLIIKNFNSLYESTKTRRLFFQKSKRLIDNNGLNRIFKIIEKKVMDIKL